MIDPTAMPYTMWVNDACWKVAEVIDNDICDIEARLPVEACRKIVGAVKP